MQYSKNETAYLAQLDTKLNRLRDYLVNESAPDAVSPDALFAHIAHINRLMGNTSNDQSFLAMLLVKRYLLNRFDLVSFDAAEKAQGAPGLDVDIETPDGQRIVGEVKTTVPYAIARRDLGAAQRTSFRKDFAKLNEAEAAHKFFFVTDPDTYAIVLERYASEIPNVEVVLLTEGT